MEINARTIIAFAKRTSRAWALLNNNKIYPVLGTKKPNYYAILSNCKDGSANGIWLVRPSGDMDISQPFAPIDAWTCPCPDWEHRQDEHMGNCKHVLAVILYRDLHPLQAQVSTQEAEAQAQHDNMKPEENPSDVLYK